MTPRHAALCVALTLGSLAAQEDPLSTLDAIASGLVVAVDRQEMADVTSAAFSPDGELLAYTNRAEGLGIVDTQTRQPVLRVPRGVDGNADPQWVAFLPGGKSVVVWDQPGEVVVRSVPDGAIQHRWPLHVEWSPIGYGILQTPGHPRIVAAVGGDRPLVVCVDVLTGDRSELEVDGEGAITALAVSPDGNTLNLTTGDAVRRDYALPGLTPGARGIVSEWATGMAFSPSTGDLAVLTDGEVFLRRATNRKVFRQYGIGDLDNPRHIAFDPSGKHLIAAGDFSIVTLDVDTRAKVFELEVTQCTTLAVHPTATQPALVFVGETCGAALLDPTDGSVVWRTPGHRGYLCGLAWSPDGTHLATTDFLEGRVCFWDIARRELVASTATGEVPTTLVARGGDAPWVLVNDLNDPIAWPLRGATEPPARTGELRYDNRIESVTAVTANRLVANLEDASTAALDLETLEWSEPFLPGGFAARALALSPDATRLLAVRNDRLFIVPMADPETAAASVAVSPPPALAAWLADDVLALISDEGELTLRRGLDAKPFVQHTLLQMPDALVPSPEGDRVAVQCLGQVWVVSTTGKLLRHVPTDDVRQLAWSPDGERLAATTDDCRVVVFDAPRD